MTDRPLIELPRRMALLPRDARGYPVPKFVQWFDGKEPTDFGVGKPDFRVVDTRHMVACVRQDLCWLCSTKLGRHKAFVLGPMCAVNRINSEPPSHYDCARFAARNCPFLTKPMARRNERALPEHTDPAGLPIDRNPGCCAIWVTASYEQFTPHAGGSGVLFRVGKPERVEFWCQGRKATREEVEASVAGGLPLLENTARRFDGPEGERALAKQVAEFRALIDEVYPRKAA